MKVEASHQEVHELLPWFANQTIAGDERSMVEQHLAECELCRHELTFLTDVSAATREFAQEMPAIEESLGKTWAAIDALEAPATPALKERLSDFVGLLWNPPTRLARSVLAAQLALILLLGGMLFYAQPEDPGFTTLSGGGGASGGPQLTLIFEPTVTEDTMRQILLGIDANVVQGPSALGVWVVEPRLVDDDPATLDSLVADLRSNTDAIRFVEVAP